MEVLECEVGFYDARGFDPGSEDVLLSGLVVGGPDSIQAVQVAGNSNTQGTVDQALGTAQGLLGHPLSEPSPRQGPSWVNVEMTAPLCPGPGGAGGWEW